ncbi:barrier-to-autointegration factor 1 [Trichinella spiralis]|uniref:barrier-to-autointegration factor 1 n=1 Tax=Trichinella spiralis TaxID=6334 RepID=UPI0001EFCB4E|nr:barrier-to-autointegration factor 1 [Trichinella spiralis]
MLRSLLHLDDDLSTQQNKNRDAQCLSDMQGSSVKHQEFVCESLEEKDVDAIAGIGPVYAKHLTKQGFDKAYVLLGQFLVLKRHRDQFVNWMMNELKIAKPHATACYNCLNEWCEQHLQ